MIVAVSDRVVLRRFDPDRDASAFKALNDDPEVVRYTGDPPFADTAAAREFLARYDHYERHGYGRWALVLRAEDAFVGFCGLKILSDSGEVDLGFRLERRLWGRGLATEAARLALAAGFGRHGLDRVVGRAMPENAASLAVLARLGFRFTHEVPAGPGQHGWRQHELRAADYAGGPVLRDIRPDDLPVLFAHQRDPEAVRMAAFTAADPDDEEAFNAKMGRILADDTITKRAITVGGELVGNVMAFDMHGEREVCYWLGREHWGRGHATAALRAFLCEHDRRPLGARVVCDNAGSLRVLEKCGFVVTGEDEGFAPGRGERVRELVLRLDGPAG